MICIQLDNKLYWLDFAYGLVYSILVVACGHIEYDKIVKLIKNMMSIVLKKVSVC